MKNKQSLRELKKEATGHALAEAAFQLAMEQGLDGFVVEEVVQRAGYSRRTFANHYSCKEEAVAMAVMPYHEVDEFIELVNKLPDETSPLDVMYHFAKMQLTEEVIRKMHQLVRMSNMYPTLRPYTVNMIFGMQTSARKVLDDLFHDRYSPVYIHLLAGAVCAAIFPLIDGDLNVLLPGQSPDEASDILSFNQFLEDVFVYLRKGF
ncbi:TetR/AcrR family transcriptional regulator [Paenibacillus sp. HN-1]|uniref:TetR/AcrR family transcriptional regulator n=1 Tax=Paenibacillus TaxID=44249 RepID=UPI001CA800D4|nr:MULTISPECIES: TetR/AcrR family transcriptional regulator [Paenibacillus]MBY9080783.1 TetR/AcrR family transcriptional regulator [Paenibacillus sp. CGMCC 1.18879]MBY9085225.1 TetR/AcrR family transcriptional regulator [Paenibacillus sinensis]